MSVVVRLLGTVDVTVGGVVRPTPGLRRKAVLARLALRPGEVVSVDQLIDAVWGDRFPATAQNTLQSNVSYLRRILAVPDVITARAPGYALTNAATDLLQAERLIEESRAETGPAERLARVDRALALWRGDPLTDVVGLPWFAQEADRLDRIRREARQTAVRCRLELGLHADLVPELEELAELHPFDEDLQAQLVIALYRSGRQADALALVSRLRTRLRDELGIDLSPPLRDLEGAVLRQDPGLDLTRHIPVTAAAPAVPPLVERGAETGVIDAALDRAVQSRTGSVLVFEGHAGLGKTSVLGHAGALAPSRGFTVVTARGTELETDYPWGCADQLFRHQPQAGGPRPDDAGEYAIINALYWRVSDLASHGPVLLVVDDLHWADPASVRFLAYLAARLDTLPVVLAIGTRPVPEHLTGYVAVIAGLPHATSRRLEPLSLDGSADLLAQTVPRDLVEQCHELCGGNPFLLRELARSLAGAGTGPIEPGEIVRPTLARFVAGQLRHLPAASVEIVHRLAVSGERTGGDRLGGAAGMDPAEVLDALTPAINAGLVVSSGVPARFSFAHPLIRRAVYDALPAGLRTKLHLRAAASAGNDVTLAATHLLHVPPGIGDPVPVLDAAADLSLARGSVDAAVTFLRRVLEEDLGEHRAAAVTRLGMAEVHVDNNAAIDSLTEALALSSGAEERVRLTHVLATALWFGCRPRDAAQICRTALDRETGASPGARQSLQALIILMAYNARHASDLMELAEGYRTLTADPSAGGLGFLGCMAAHEAHRNRRETAERYALEVLGDHNLHRAISDPVGEQGASMAWYALAPCDSPRALASIDTALAHYRRAGSLRGIAPLSYYRAVALYDQGYLTDALADVHRSLEATALSGLSLGHSYLLGVRLRTLVALGRVEEATSVLAGFTRPPGLTSVMYEGDAAAVHLANGDVQRAYESVLAARDDCLTRPITNPVLGGWHVPLVRCLLLLGRPGEADATASDLLRAAEEWGAPRAIGTALRTVASLRPGEEVELLEESVHLLHSTPAKLELARSLAALGEALHRANRTEDANHALYRALELATLCGAVPLRDSVARTLRTTAGSAFVPPVVTALTPAETEISALASAGATDREIAETLHLTLSSVRASLSSVHRKRTVRPR
ncbi:BTAD domain-containing putative transcriptional regulator [Actinocorallia longicatena]|uniref:BTAD domain-containing putative transcriptional regulator n=1 Tax=Actinocorallia longicatena TaxID=111803 RepID=A0ABP6QHI6_9ACTN